MVRQRGGRQPAWDAWSRVMPECARSCAPAPPRSGAQRNQADGAEPRPSELSFPGRTLARTFVSRPAQPTVSVRHGAWKECDLGCTRRTAASHRRRGSAQEARSRSTGNLPGPRSRSRRTAGSAANVPRGRSEDEAKLRPRPTRGKVEGRAPWTADIEGSLDVERLGTRRLHRLRGATSGSRWTRADGTGARWLNRQECSVATRRPTRPGRRPT